jgi:hypothetical protein
MRENEDVYLHRLRTEIFPKAFSKGATLSDLAGAFERNDLPMEVSGHETTWVMAQGTIEAINKAMPFLMQIADKPRSFIKTVEETTPIETAKKISHMAISKLSRDSKDWNSRSLTMVRPKNIAAEINEETLNIYENRVVVSLVKRLLSAVYSKRVDVEEKLQKARATASEKAINSVLGINSLTSSAWSFSTYQKALWNSLRNGGGDNAEKELDDYKELLRTLEHLSSCLSRFLASPLYRELAKLKRVPSPIQRTNIFIYDRRYKEAYNLWKILDQDAAQSKSPEKSINENEDLYPDYFLYCALSICYSLVDMGYHDTTPMSTLVVDGDRIRTTNKIIATKDGASFCLEMDSNQKAMYLTLLKDKKATEILLPVDDTNFENMDEPTILQYTEKVLDNNVVLEKPKKWGKEAWVYTFVSFDMAQSKIGQALTNKTMRRFLSIGDFYDPSEPKIKEWGGHKTGFLLCHPAQDFRNNLLRIERLLGYFVFGKTLQDENGGHVCPICGAPTLRSYGGDDFVCTTCKHAISYSFDSTCSIDKSHEKFLWVRPSENKYLENEHILDAAQNMTGFHLLEFNQYLMGKYATTAFTICLHEGRIKEQTICPKCGHELGKPKD